MSSFARKVIRFLKAEEGPTAVEYAMMVLLVFLVCISIITVMGQSASESFDDSNESIEAALDQRS